MKALSVKQWIALAVAAVFLITIVVLYFCVPVINHYLSGGLIGLLAGFIGGYVCGRKNLLGKA